MVALRVAVDATARVDGVVPPSSLAVAKVECEVPPGLMPLMPMPCSNEVAKVACVIPPRLFASPWFADEVVKVDCHLPPGLSNAFSSERQWRAFERPTRTEQSLISPSLSTDAGSSGGDRDSEADSVPPSSDDQECEVMESGRTPLRLGSSNFVPKELYQQAQQAVTASWSETPASDEPPKTSVMFSIPGRYREDRVIKLLHAAGLEGRYDCVHVPVHSKTQSRAANKGYAFVNFLTHEDANWCYSELHGKTIPDSERACYVKWAASQGEQGKCAGSSTSES